ncbi:hypothetical protein [Oceaniradius stylonematis]|uniref:hypothetical protein n=1 Tax=Oceaniradius stylonematis TaxID=2184161 RepID=UPI0011C47FEF|nr:hypothetical protein [Oceaniradius stylonematis]
MPDREDQAFRTAPTLPEGSTGCILFTPWLALDNHVRKHDRRSELLGTFARKQPSTSTRKQKPPSPEGLEQSIRIPLKDHFPIACMNTLATGVVCRVRRISGMWTAVQNPARVTIVF